MNKKGFDMCADNVQIDLHKMKAVLSAAIANSRDIMQKYQASIDNHLRNAIIAKCANDEEMEYIHNCNANTERNYFTVAASQYAEAIKRETVKVVK